MYLKATSEYGLHLCSFLKIKGKKPEQTFLCALSLLTFIEITKQLFKGHKDESKVTFYLPTFKGGGDTLPPLLRGLFRQNICKALSPLRRMLNYDFLKFKCLDIKKFDMLTIKNCISDLRAS